MIEERWLPVVGYEGLYEVSSLGRVRSLNYLNRHQKEILKLQKHRNGYVRICLCKNNTKGYYSVHRLVAFAFPEICGKWFKGAVCNHKNEVKWDNRAENLEWCTTAYNNKYGTHIENIIKKLRTRVAQYTIDGTLVKIYDSIHDAAKETGFSAGSICNCCKGKRKTCGGFIWHYV